MNITDPGVWTSVSTVATIWPYPFIVAVDVIILAVTAGFPDPVRNAIPLGGAEPIARFCVSDKPGFVVNIVHISTV